MVEIRTAARKRFMVAPGLFLLTRNMLMQKYDANGNGRIDPEEHAAVMKDAAALYWARMKEMMDLYDLDQDGVLSRWRRSRLWRTAIRTVPCMPWRNRTTLTCSSGRISVKCC